MCCRKQSLAEPHIQIWLFIEYFTRLQKAALCQHMPAAQMVTQ